MAAAFLSTRCGGRPGWQLWGAWPNWRSRPQPERHQVANPPASHAAVRRRFRAVGVALTGGAIGNVLALSAISSSSARTRDGTMRALGITAAMGISGGRIVGKSSTSSPRARDSLTM